MLLRRCATPELFSFYSIKARQLPVILTFKAGFKSIDSSSPSVTMLCNVCQSIFQGNFNDSLSNPFGRDHHHSPRDLELAASNGCYICDALWRRYQFRKPATESGDSSAANADLQESSFEPGRSNFSRYDLKPIVSADETISIELTIALNLYFLQGATLEWSYECSLCSFRLQPNSGIIPLKCLEITYPNSRRSTVFLSTLDQYRARFLCSRC